MLILIPMPSYSGGGGYYPEQDDTWRHSKWRGKTCDWCAGRVHDIHGHSSHSKLRQRLRCYGLAHSSIWLVVKHMLLVIGLIIGLVVGLTSLIPDGTYQQCHIPAPNSTQKFVCDAIGQDDYVPHATNPIIEHRDGSKTWFVSHAD